MTDTTGSTLTDSPKDSSSQMIVALATVFVLALIALGSLVVVVVCQSQTPIITALVAIPSMVVGALANSLASPSGITSVIASARKPPAP
jgi:hypothetical protein